jgi:hypothetical protein
MKLCFLVAAAACGGDGGAEGRRWSGIVDTLESGVIRVSSPAEGEWDDASRWRLVEDVRIGRVEGEGPDVFGQIGDVAVDDRGRIHVLESQAHEVRVFDTDGSWVRTLGGQGEGPGELDVPFGGAIHLLDGGTVVVNNSMNRRWEVFSGEGDFITSVPLTSMAFGTGGSVGPDGAIYQRDMVIRPSGERETSLLRWTFADGTLVVTDTIEAPELPEATTFEVSSSVGGRTMIMDFPVPFVHQPGWQFGGDGRFRVEPGDGYRIVVLDQALDTVRIIERQYTPVPVTEARIAEREEALQDGPLADADLDRSLIPEHHPAFSVFRLDDTGHLWVQRYLGDGERAWDVFDTHGRYLGEIEADLPLTQFTIHAIRGGYVYGVVRGDLDVPVVVRLRIEEGAAPL